MPRLRNLINDKSRKSSCVVTEATVTYKIPVADEKDKLGHFQEVVLEDGFMIVRYATKKEVEEFRIEPLKQQFIVSFD